MPRRIWVTRTQPEADATAARLAALGHTPVVAPVLEARAMGGSALDVAGVGALAFTSAHAVAAFAATTTLRSTPVFTVGAATARRAREAGFDDVRAGDGDVAALADLIVRSEPRPALVLHPGAVQPAADLVALLAERGVLGRGVAVYETIPTDLAAPPDDIDVVLIHSARAANRVADLLAAASRSDIQALAISEAAARPLRVLGLTHLAVAPFPNEAALLDLLN